MKESQLTIKGDEDENHLASVEVEKQDTRHALYVSQFIKIPELVQENTLNL